MIACLYVVYTYYVHILGQRPSIASYTIPTVPWSKCADCAPSSKLAAKAGHYDCMSVCRIYVLCAFYGPAPLHRKLHDSKDSTNCTLTVHAVAILRHLHPLRVDIRIRCLCLRWVPTLYGRRNLGPKHDAEALVKALDNPMSMRTETSLRAIGRDDPAKL